VKDASLRDGVRCDAVGCIGRLTDGRLVSFALASEAFAEDCTRAAVVVSAREAPADCSGLLIDRKSWRANGAMALRWTGARFEATAARPPGYERPWAPRPRNIAETAPASSRPAVHDATPRAEDLKAGD
jgi:competence protein ComEC